MKISISKDTTMEIKGIAIILMFLHHFFTFPHYWINGVWYSFWDRWSSILCKPFQICVPIFCFITGYFYFGKNRKDIKYSCKKALQLLIPYWIITSLFIMISIICGNKYSVLDVLLELFALKRPTMIFCWYVYFYIASLFLLLVFSIISFKNPYIKYCLTALIFSVVLVIVNNIIPVFDTLIVWFPIMISGYFCAEFDILNNIFTRCKNSLIMMICLPLFIISSLMRWCLPDISYYFNGYKIIYITLDILYAPLAVWALATIFFQLSESGINCNILTKVGEKSMYMWFIHCIFFNNCKLIFQPILYWPKYSLLVLIWGVFICYMLSCLFVRVCSPIEQRIVKLFRVRNEERK